MTDTTEKILDIKGKSEDDFEKNITYISAGTLVLSLTFIEKIIPLQGASFIVYLVWSWILLAVTLLVNLFSHQLASLYGDLAYEEICNGDKEHQKKVYRRNKIMRGINISTIFTLICGISLLICFATKNAYAMADKSRDTIKPQTIEPDTFKGRTYPPHNPSSGSSTPTSPQIPSTGSNSGNDSGSSTTQPPKKD